ncbi:MAG: hypothetical protein J7K39_06335 [Bacteroidales bacterium]|nr:hypothetical protein [Bacteroidales bacterium]RLD36621.1 MAG: hypothetical protein DRI74_08730 [Bacteroidota bacterium]
MYLTQSFFDNQTEVLKEIEHLSYLHQNTIHPSKLLEFSWILYTTNTEQAATTYIFRERNNELLIVNDGRVQKGNWEILVLSNSMLISNGEVEMLYNIDFFCDEGFILRKENMDEYLVLIKRSKKQLQTKSLLEVFAAFMDSYNKNQRRFDNIDLEPNNALLEFEDITEFKEYSLFPYVTILATILLVIAIIVFVALKFWQS